MLHPFEPLQGTIPYAPYPTNPLHQTFHLQDTTNLKRPKTQGDTGSKTHTIHWHLCGDELYSMQANRVLARYPARRLGSDQIEVQLG